MSHHYFNIESKLFLSEFYFNFFNVLLLIIKSLHFNFIFFLKSALLINQNTLLWHQQRIRPIRRLSAFNQTCFSKLQLTSHHIRRTTTPIITGWSSRINRPILILVWIGTCNNQNRPIKHSHCNNIQIKNAISEKLYSSISKMSIKPSSNHRFSK